MYSENQNAAINRQLKKEIFASKPVHSLDNLQNITIVGPGNAEISEEITYNGNSTLKVTYPHLVFPIPKSERNYDCTRIRLDFDKEDWSEYNRISFWVYPERNGFDHPHILMEYKSEGEKPFPNRNFLSGCHSAVLNAGKWNHVIWEIPDLSRDAVTMFQFNFVSCGMQKNMKPDSIFYISNFELQSVSTDKYMGWDTEDKISFCHSGYSGEDKKIAVTSLAGEDEFYILESATDNIAFTGKVKTTETDIGIFSLLDFSKLCAEGTYYIKYKDICTKPFKIAQNHLDSAIDKIRNFFNKERCGCTVEGIHLPCHLNCFTEHADGRKLSVAGGWHDAADLSQGLCNTAEAVHSFIDASLSLKEKNPELSESLLSEARYGLEWILGTRFEDGFRCVWNTSSIWKSGYINNEDEVSVPAERKPFEGLCACAAEAAAFSVYKDTEPMLADYCLKCAVEDFSFAIEDLNPEDSAQVEVSGAVTAVQLYAEASFAACCLYKATQKEEYLNYAVSLADYVLRCQQNTLTDWDIPFCGFFYEDSTKITPLNYDHRAHEQMLIMCFAELMKAAPHHEKYGSWKNALELYRSYINKLMEFASPYRQIPSGIYFTDAPATLTGSGDHKKARFTDEKYIRQLESGIKLNDGVYLRRMPVALIFRGSYGVQLSKAKAVSTLGLALKDNSMLQLAKQQLAWILGNNPFSRSYMYGEGYDYPNMNAVSNSADVAGQIPVGMQSFEDTDIPYMPMTNQATYFEVWVHPASRMLWTIADLEEN